MSVTLTIVESDPNWNLILSFDSDPPHLAYILSFHLSLDAAVNAAWSYLHTSDLTNTYARPKHSFRLADPPPKTPHRNVALSDQTWDFFTEQTRLYKYNGRASYLGVSMYLLALLDANPTPDDWADNRHVAEPDLPELNDALAEQDKLPLWNDSEITDRERRHRPLRTFPTQKLDTILARLEPIAVAHQVTPMRDDRDLFNKRRWASAALEAIGLQYLKPKNPPKINPMPAKRDRRHHHDAQKADEGFRIY